MKTATFALIFGIAYLVAGLLGLVPAALARRRRTRRRPNSPCCTATCWACSR